MRRTFHLEMKVPRGFRLVDHLLDHDAPRAIRHHPVNRVAFLVAQDRGANVGQDRQLSVSLIRVLRIDEGHFGFLVIQMQIGPDGRGSGTLADAAKLRAYANTLELETFTIAPIMLRDIEARPLD